jgi:hypothetical protein
MKKERIELTDITLHARSLKATGSFEKVARKGRTFSAITSETWVSKPTDPSSIGLALLPLLPPDLRERFVRGEVTLLVPKTGLPLKIGDDLKEKLIKAEKAERHRRTPRVRVLRSNETGLQ